MQDELYIKRCFELALKGKWWVAPNPMVGAVLVADGRVIGEGWHRAYGQAHAEVNAVAGVAEADRNLLSGATLYCSLEPCFHVGKTPPCVDLVLRHGIGKVVISNLDPNPLVAGQSVAKLRAQGVEVVTGLLETEGKALNAVFFHHIQHKRPYITLKWAQSLDGYLGKIGERTPISHPETLPLVHQWRAEHAAILVGTQTALVDNPRLDIRHLDQPDEAPPIPAPKRFVLDFSNRLPPTSHLLSDTLPTWVIGGPQRQFDTPHKHHWTIPAGDQLWPALLDRMYREERISSLLVEGGAKVLNQLLTLELFNQILVIRSNTALNNGVPAPDLPADQLNLKNIYPIADNLVFCYTRK
jgi:diaminohydroxyphosphoribosylaminopyrimidine deaminase / 5-amino-6-(5-phosphoribosylamino)uracil reductase